MPVVHELACGEDGGDELGAVDNCVQTSLEQADQGLGRVTLAAGGFLVGPRELLLGQVAVIALQLLLGPQLQAEVGGLLLAALAMLAGALGALVDRGLRATPDVLAHPPVKLVFRRVALRHVSSLFM